MHEYRWSREYTVWRLPASAGLKYYSAIHERLTGENLLEKNYQDRLLTALALRQREINREMGWTDGKGSI